MGVLGILSLLLFEVWEEVCKLVFNYSVFLLWILFFMVVLKGQPCAWCCMSRVESWSNEREGFGRTEVKVEREHAREMEAPVGTGVMHSLLGAQSPSWTNGLFDCCLSCLQAVLRPLPVSQAGEEGSPWYCKSGMEFCQCSLGSEGKGGLKLSPVLF